jgi:hypothetical protein
MTTPPEPGSPDTGATQRRVAALRQAAQDKRVAAVARAEAGLRNLIKNGDEITFRAVANSGSVSLDFLYSHDDLRRRIEMLRSQQKPASPKPERPPTPGDGTLVHILTSKLKQERLTAKTRIDDLEQRLAAVHGELLQMRRRLQEHGIEQ